MNKKILAICLASFIASTVLESQVISPPSERDDLLAGMTNVLSNTGREAPDFSTVESPFHEAMEPVKAKETEAPETVVQEVAILTDRDALRAITNRFEVQGSLLLGNRGILQLTDGRTIEEGSTFEAKIQGKSYSVLLDEVTRTSYRLKLGEAVVEKSFLKENQGVNP